MKVAGHKDREPSHEEVEITNELWCVLFPDATVNCRRHLSEPEVPATAQAKDRDMWLIVGILMSVTLAVAILL